MVLMPLVAWLAAMSGEGWERTFAGNKLPAVHDPLRPFDQLVD